MCDKIWSLGVTYGKDSPSETDEVLLVTDSDALADAIYKRLREACGVYEADPDHNTQIVEVDDQKFEINASNAFCNELPFVKEK